MKSYWTKMSKLHVHKKGLFHGWDGVLYTCNCEGLDKQQKSLLTVLQIWGHSFFHSFISLFLYAGLYMGSMKLMWTYGQLTTTNKLLNYSYLSCILSQEDMAVNSCPQWRRNMGHVSKQPKFWVTRCKRNSLQWMGHSNTLSKEK